MNRSRSTTTHVEPGGYVIAAVALALLVWGLTALVVLLI